MLFPERHQLLRDRRRWLGVRSGLAVDRDGDLLLARVPAPADGKAIDIAVTYPYQRETSGLAVGPCDAVFVADSAHDRVLFIDGLCESRTWVPAEAGPPFDAPGHFRSPRGLAVTAEALLVADSGNGRLQNLALPLLEASAAWTRWITPTAISVDSNQRVLVVDATASTVHRVLAGGQTDGLFGGVIASQGKLQKPLAVASGDQDCILVSDAGANSVFVFDPDGGFAFTLPGPGGWQPGAIAAFGARVFVADAVSGAIFVFDHIEQNGGADAEFTGEVKGWRGPVTALAVGASGDLFIKPALDATYYRFAADTAFVAEGVLTAGPFDAGEERTWERAWIHAQATAATTLGVQIVLKDTPAPPVLAEWLELPSYDVLLSEQVRNCGRFIWIKLLLSTSAVRQSPRVRQARAATGAEDLHDYLPFSYRRSDKDADGFLARWLKLLGGEFHRIEELLADMPRTGDVKFVPATALPWLAQWLALELPKIANDEKRRALLARAVRLFTRRGTKDSIAEFVELHTGIRPAIVEAFHDRRVWILGASSRLDFDTRLPDLDPLGMIVADESAGDGCCPDNAAPTPSACSPCAAGSPAAPPATNVQTPIGRAIVGEGGPLAAYQIGLPLFADTAYRFCVVVDGYRAHDEATRKEIARIVEREKPAHTDYHIDYIAPELRVGLQARVGIDAIIGGDPPPLRLSSTLLNFDTQLPPADVARFGQTMLDGALTLI